MTKEIIKYPNPVLRKKCEEVKEITEEIKTLALALVQILEKSQGIGLAASQIGELKRIIAVQTGKGTRVFINPRIITKTKETEAAEEGCLSFPGLFLKIKRAKRVEIEALNEDSEILRIKAEGFPARVFQHEIDHLDGILFIDQINLWQRIKLKSQKRLN